MRPKEEEIKKAQKALSELDPSRNSEEYYRLVYTATGKKTEFSPKESNRSFFHLNNINCEMRIGKDLFVGVFNHPDYAPYYTLTTEKEILYFSGGENEFEGRLFYKDYKPDILKMSAKYPIRDLGLLIANTSLTYSCL